MTELDETAGAPSSFRKVPHDLLERGYAIVEQCLSAEHVSRLIKIIEMSTASWHSAAVRRRSEVYAVRNLLEVAPDVLAVFQAPLIRAALCAAVGPCPHLTKAILFDKTASANWHVSWHQDLSVAVKARHAVAGWGNWSVKAGVHHAQPPADVLAQMVTLRVHLDLCLAEHGALRVIPGTHLLGRLDEAQIRERARSIAPVTCAVAAGGLLLLKPLLMHASSAATSVGHRRVLHFEFSPVPPPVPLEWRHAAVDVGPRDALSGR